jgi:UDP-glucose 4-epimerase
MRVLVTGGAGFIGSHIIDLLRKNGHETFALDDLSSGRRENLPADVPLHVADICRNDALTRIFDEVRPDAVCHQAAQMSVSRSVREPGFDAEVNILGLVRVLEHAVRVGARRFVFASSGGVLYGNVTEPAPETTPASPISPYGISKWAGEQYLKFFSAEHPLQTVALRYSNVYGPRQNPHGEAGVVAIFSQKMLRGEPATVNGDGRYIRDYVYVGDVARANVLALESNLSQPFTPLNVGTGQGTDVNELASAVRNLASDWLRRQGKPHEIPESNHGPARAGDLRSNLVNASHAAQTLGWKPEINLTPGLRTTVEWFADHA